MVLRDPRSAPKALGFFAYLLRSCGDRKRMAEVADLHPSTLREKLKEYGEGAT